MAISAQEKWDKFQYLLCLVQNSLASLKLCRLHNRKNNQKNGWKSCELRKLEENRDAALEKWQKTRNENDKERFLLLKSAANKLLRKEESEHYVSKCIQTKTSRDRWKLVKQLLKEPCAKVCNIESLCLDGKTAVSRKDIANMMNAFLGDIGRVKRTSKSLKEIISICPREGMELKLLTELYILKLLRSINTNKPAGHDDIHPVFLKLSALYIYQPLTHIFNTCLLSTEIPYQWKLANVTPVFKKGDENDPNNHRPISVLPAIGKLFEKALHHQIYAFLERNQLLFKNQCGYRSGYSTEDAIIKLTQDLSTALNNNEHSAVVFLDLTKAFDCVQHDILLEKLARMGFGKHSVSLLANYVSSRKQRVKINDTYSDWSEIKNGVPQGSLLGPLLFLIYVNAISDDIEKSTVVSYADDTALYYSHSNKDTLITQITQDLETLVKHFDKLLLKVNHKKTQVLLCSNSQKVKESVPEVKLNGSSLNIVKEANYLGIIIDEKLTFKSHVENIVRKMAVANTSMNYIKHCLNRSSKKLLYETLVLSALYCPTVWAFSPNCLLHKLKVQQNWSLRNIENLGYMTSVKQLKMEGIYTPVECLLQQSVLKFIYKQLVLRPKAIHSELFSLSPRHDNLTLQINFCRVNTFAKSIRHSGIVLWNSLDPAIRQSSFSTFKNELKSYLLSQYKGLITSDWVT